MTGKPDLLGRLTGLAALASFALLHRPEANRADRIVVLAGDVSEVATIADIPLPPAGARDRHEVLAVLPYRQIAERGYEHRDDGEPLIVMDISEQASVPLTAVLARLDDAPVEASGGRFDVDDEQYAEIVRRIVAEEIGRGAGANFVIRRTFTADIRNWSRPVALAFFTRLLRGTSGAYWTFLIHTGGRSFVGASPERHVTVNDGTAMMNPISGTYRFPATGPSAPGVLEFLADRKEINELYMVVDEELKMMSKICGRGGRVIGPRLREMPHLAHTEYFIKGRSDRDVRDVIRQTLFAPTVTGSPLESACRVIARFEPSGRGYYAGMAALIGRDRSGARVMDSAILIRTADISRAGRLRLGVGSTLVRDSEPRAEAAETKAKAAGLLAALDRAAVPGSPAGREAPRLSAIPAVERALAARNAPLADFWRTAPDARERRLPGMVGRTALLIDGEDMFTAMDATLLRALGLDVQVRRFDEEYRIDGSDVVVVGPGPGDPRDLGDARIARMRRTTHRLLESGTPFLSICLGHQILSAVLGLRIIRKDVPNQGVQREIDLFGRREPVYFYNTFTALSGRDSARRSSSRAVTVPKRSRRCPWRPSPASWTPCSKWRPRSPMPGHCRW